MVNTKLLPPEQRPKSWLDLADPKWRGKLAVGDPSLPGGSVQSFHALKELLGEQYMRDLLANITIVQGVAGSRAVATGEYPMHLDQSYTDYVRVKEAPVELVVPEEGAPTYYSDAVHIFKDAPHPNAAKVWSNWQATKEGQEVSASFGETPIRADVPPLSPLQALDGSTKLLPGTPKGVQWEREVNAGWRAWVQDILKSYGKK